MARALQMLVVLTSTVSLSLCLASAALWIRSHYVFESLSRPALDGDRLFHSRAGTIHWRAIGRSSDPHTFHYVPPESMPGRWRYERGPVEPPPPDYPATGDPGIRVHWRFLGVQWVRSDGSPPLPPPNPFLSGGGRVSFLPSHGLTVPYALMVVLFAALPALRFGSWWLRRTRDRRRRARGLCPACGYDLRGSPAGGRCPECGGILVQP